MKLHTLSAKFDIFRLEQGASRCRLFAHTPLSSGRSCFRHVVAQLDAFTTKSGGQDNCGRDISPAKRLSRQEMRAIPLLADKVQLEVLYEDEWVLVLNKPAGLKHEPNHRFVGGSLVNAVIGHLGFEPFTVHRLDMYTSGAIIFAKSRDGARLLSAAFQEGKVDKRYLAVVHGLPTPEPFSISAPIARNPDHKFARMVAPEGQPAWTDLRVLAQNFDSGASLLEATLRTGRTHQIRVHLQSAGLPLVGDELYGCCPVLWDGVYGPNRLGERNRSSMGGDGQCNRVLQMPSLDPCASSDSQRQVQVQALGDDRALPGTLGESEDAISINDVARTVPPLEPLQRQALHASRIVFPLPFLGHTLCIVAPVSFDIRATMQRLGLVDNWEEVGNEV